MTRETPSTLTTLTIAAASAICLTPSLSPVVRPFEAPSGTASTDQHHWPVRGVQGTPKVFMKRILFARTALYTLYIVRFYVPIVVIVGAVGSRRPCGTERRARQWTIRNVPAGHIGRDSPSLLASIFGGWSFATPRDLSAVRQGFDRTIPDVRGLSASIKADSKSAGIHVSGVGTRGTRR